MTGSIRAALLLLAALAGQPGVEQAPAARGGRAGHEGSELCTACHPAEAAQWTDSLHARSVNPPTEKESDLLDRSLLCGEYDAKLVLGERHALRFMVDSTAEPGRHVLLPCRYDVGPAEWTHLHESDWKTLTWERGCGACHTTGFSSGDLSFVEMNVGCEACHGAASRHGDYKTAGSMVAFGRAGPAAEATICASCHLQGGVSASTGLNYARDYEPGGDLFSDYRFDWTTLDEISADVENPLDIHQKLLIRKLAGDGKGMGPTNLRCSSCHAAHRMQHDGHESLEREEFCYLCHAQPDFTLKEYDQSCNVCEF